MQNKQYPVVRRPGVIGERIEQEAVLLLPEAGQVLVLNELGWTIWELLDGQRGPAELTAAIAAEYDVSESQAQADLEAFLAELRARGALK